MSDEALISAVSEPMPAQGFLGGNWYGFQSPTDSNKYKWRPSFDRDTQHILSEYRHKIILDDSRHIYCSGGGIVSGAVNKKADYAVGDAFDVVYNGPDTEWKSIVEEQLSEALPTISIRGHSWQRVWRLVSIAIDRDGDIFIRFVKDELGQPKLQLVPAHRIGSEGLPEVIDSGPYAGNYIHSGVVLDAYMRPLGYNLLWTEYDRIVAKKKGKDLPKFNIIPASQMIHIGDPKFSDEVRNIPSISYGILDWYDVSEIRDLEKLAVKANSSIAIVETNENGRASAADMVRPGQKTETGMRSTVFDGGLIRYIKTGGSISAHQSDRPSQSWSGFMEFIIRGAFNGMDWPMEIAFDMSKLGGASVRAVVGQARRSIEARQSVMYYAALRCVDYLVGAWMASGAIPFNNTWRKFTISYPSKLSVDLGHDAKNRREDYSSGITSIGDIMEEQGLTAQGHFEKRASDYLAAQAVATAKKVPIEYILRDDQKPSVDEPIEVVDEDN